MRIISNARGFGLC